MTNKDLDLKQLKDLLQELSDDLESRGVKAQLFVVGGAAMALAYDRRRVTQDVDAFFEPAPQVRESATAIAERHGLEPDWLNDAVKGFLPTADTRPRTVFESDSLLVQVPSPEYLLAMKLHASRGNRDLNDAATLYNHLGYTPQQATDLLARTYPASMLLPKHIYVIAEVSQRAETLRSRAQPAKTRATRPMRRPEQQQGLEI